MWLHADQILQANAMVCPPDSEAYISKSDVEEKDLKESQGQLIEKLNKYNLAEENVRNIKIEARGVSKATCQKTALFRTV